MRTQSPSLAWPNSAVEQPPGISGERPNEWLKLGGTARKPQAFRECLGEIESLPKLLGFDPENRDTGSYGKGSTNGIKWHNPPENIGVPAINENSWMFEECCHSRRYTNLLVLNSTTVEASHGC